jgi:putative drug exporter of the RND superfamily
VVILLFAFGTVTAMLLPITTALLGLVASLSLIRLLGHIAEVPSVAPTLGTTIGLGVGIDYALFIVTRHKLQLRDGMDLRESIARANATSGGAVFFAGGTVVIALVSLLASDMPLVGTMGYSAAISVVVAVLAATTLLPALLGALDFRINSLRVKLGRTVGRAGRGRSPRPWRSMLAAIAILAVLAAPVLNLQLGSSDAGELPESTTARQAYDLMSEGFGPGSNGPLLVSARLGSAANRTSRGSTKSTSSSRSWPSSSRARRRSSPSSSRARGFPSSRRSRRPSSRSSRPRSRSSRRSTSRSRPPPRRPPTRA